ncbi:hypothetical protein EVAR_6962_1 [Eumeta japonica]|uniref:Uncharacterized protein n=1 Tax=Eumeta variegata TaxID=151549 RepID=A0A4C1THL9_EUMVA|nr:hypothetical protein EVAR_6962_1 [Eumeta japonica]
MQSICPNVEQLTEPDGRCSPHCEIPAFKVEFPYGPTGAIYIRNAKTLHDPSALQALYTHAAENKKKPEAGTTLQKEDGGKNFATSQKIVTLLLTFLLRYSCSNAALTLTQRHCQL